MNAQAPIVAAEPAPARQHAWERYIPAVNALFPSSCAVETKARAKLMLLRDSAAKAQPTASWEARQLLLTVEQLANAHALTAMPVHMLAFLAATLGRIYRDARNLEEVFGEHGRG